MARSRPLRYARLHRIMAVTCMLIAGCGTRAPIDAGAGGTGVGVTAAPVAVDSATLLHDIGVLAHDSMEGRAAGTPGNAKARAFLDRRFAQIGLEPLAGGVGYQHAFTFERRGETTRGVNLLGLVRGTLRPDRYIVVTAHYDHVGIREGEVFNGADDNASGTAALLQIAEYFATHAPRHSLIFAALDAEENGLQGARAFVAQTPVARAEIVQNINMDMVGRNDAGELYVAGTYHYPELLPLVQRVAAQAEVRLIPGHDRPDAAPGDDWTNSSDHGPFHAAGIPFLYFGVEDHADYHRATDELRGIQPGFYARAVRTVLTAVRLLDAELN